MAKKKTTTKRMATKKKVNKSAAIKDYLATYADARPTEVSAALKKRGISVTPGYVSGIKSKMKSNGKPKTKRARRNSVKETSPIEDVKLAGELMYDALELVMKAGYKEAQAMVEMAGKMVERVRDGRN